MRSEWLMIMRVVTLVADVTFMILLPAAVHIRVDFLGRTWLLIGAIEIAFLGDCIQIISRIMDDDPWNWFVSPIFMVAGVLGIAYVLRAGHQ